MELNQTQSVYLMVDYHYFQRQIYPKGTKINYVPGVLYQTLQILCNFNDNTFKDSQ